MSIFTRKFWIQAGERAIRASAYAGITGFGVSTRIDEVDLLVVLSMMVGMAALSILGSLAGSAVGDPNDPSFLR